MKWFDVIEVFAPRSTPRSSVADRLAYISHTNDDHHRQTRIELAISRIDFSVNSSLKIWVWKLLS